LTVLAATWLARRQPPAWALVAAIVALGAGSALFGPALQAVLPPLVGPQTRLAPGDQAAAMRAVLVVWNIGTLIGIAAF